MQQNASWESLGSVEPSALTAARLVAHWAAQVPAALGNTLVLPRPDFAHLALAWDPAAGVLATRPTQNGLRAGLRLATLTAVVLDGDAVAQERALSGLTLAEALGWLAEAVGAESVARPEHKLPGHPVAEGAPFALGDPAALAELERWYADAVPLLEAVCATHAGAAPVRCWPHHFDVATLITLDPELDPEQARSVGVGLSPGDGTYGEPYFYVTPWPYPEGVELPALSAGGWHTAGWTGAVLTGGELVASSDRQGQESTARTFLAEAVRAARSLLAAR